MSGYHFQALVLYIGKTIEIYLMAKQTYNNTDLFAQDYTLAMKGLLENFQIRFHLYIVKEWFLFAKISD